MVDPNAKAYPIEQIYDIIQIPLWSIPTKFTTFDEAAAANSDSSMVDPNSLGNPPIHPWAEDIQIPLWSIPTRLAQYTGKKLTDSDSSMVDPNLHACL